MARFPDTFEQTASASEIDLRALGAALSRRRRAIIIPTLLAFVGIAIFVNVVTPRYTAETQVLLENQETFFTRPDRVSLPPDQVSQLDEQAVSSQVQLISSRDIARRAIRQLHLAGNSEFDPLADGLNPFVRLAILVGLMPDPTRETADARMVTKFLDRLVVFSPPKTRVIAIQFTSRDADLAARTANTIAQLYLQEQSAAKRATARDSADALASQIGDLRNKLAAADSEREQYRLQSGLLSGTNNMTISGQQLAEINSDLSKARSAQADAQAKASMIRDLIRSGKATDVVDVINNDIVRRVSEQRFAAQAALARQSRTLLPGHPLIKELAGQVAEYDLALKQAAKQSATSLENEARIAGQRVANLESALAQQTKVAGVANGDEVHLRALDRVAQTYKDQLESSTTKYQEALARQSSTATPSDARVISSAAPPQEPSYPKKIPFIAFGTIATLFFSVGFVVASELLSGRATYEPTILDRQDREAPPVVAAPIMGTETPRRARFFADEPEPAETEAEADPVFAPVVAPPSRERPSVEKLRGHANSGMLAATFSYLKAFGRSAAASRPAAGTPMPAPTRAGNNDFGWDQDADATDVVSVPEATDTKIDVAALVERIVDAHLPGRGLHIVGAGTGDVSGLDLLIGVGRELARKGRAIVVDLNRTPSSLAGLAAFEGDGLARVMTMHGLAELLAGDASFAEVIHRDQASRLHFIPTGLQEADFRDFDLILDALSETYDFIVLLTPAFPQSEIAKIMAPYADFVVLAASRTTRQETIANLESELIAAGAREVLVPGFAGLHARQVA